MGRRKKTVHGEKKLPTLPWELIEEILSRVPPQSLGGFRIVSKKWNTLFDDKTFLNNHKSTFRFILRTESKLYSVSIDPEVVVRELTMDIPGLESPTPEHLVDCGEFLLCYMGDGSAVWNPWLKQARMIKNPSYLRVEHGIGYESHVGVKVNGYQTIATDSGVYGNNIPWKIHDFATGAWEELKMGYVDSSESTRATLYTRNGVSCNGNLYWVAYYNKTDPLYHVREFEFSSQSFCHFCDLPCLKNHEDDALVLQGFNGDQLSLLKQCHKTRKIEIWVTKNKINSDDDDDVVWTNVMEVSIPNLPDLRSDSTQPSYFIDDKRIVVCCCSETGRAWIYIMGENKLISKTKINSMVDRWPLHCTYFPTLVPVPVPVPRGKKKNRRGKRKDRRGKRKNHNLI